MEELDALKSKLARERKARQQAETILEEKSRELYLAHRELERTTTKLKEELSEHQRLAVELGEKEAKLGRSQQRLSSIMNSVMDAVISFDGDGVLQTYNRAAERIFGFSVTEMIGQKAEILLPEPHRGDVATAIRTYLETRDPGLIGVTREVEGRRKDGSHFPMEMAITEMDLAESDMFVGIYRDITRRKERDAERAELERELSQAQKLESLGTLAGGIAHEINTPVQYVGDNVRFLQDAFADIAGVLDAYAALAAAASGEAGLAAAIDTAHAACAEADTEYLVDEVPRSIAQTLEGIGRISEIVKAIKEFSHPDGKEKTALDINHAIATTLTVTRNQWKYVADIVEDLDAALPPVPCLPGEFNQVVLNLVVNAAHAIEDVCDEGSKGQIAVQTRKDGDWAEITIADTGGGIPQENLKKIFDPFFTTKEPGKGTGQGLAIAHTIITKKHGGTIAVRSRPGVGTAFTIRLPLADSGVTEEAA